MDHFPILIAPILAWMNFEKWLLLMLNYRAEKRDFEDGYELEDWLEAERDISSQRRYWLR
jgi:Protein of unknown function (DUF2934)